MHTLAGYYPKQFTLVNGKAMVLLAPIAEAQFNHPFINQITKKISNTACLLIELDSYSKAIEALPKAKISGIIFHHGRCGSTLLGNILAQHKHTRVIFEPGAIADLLMSNTCDENKCRWLKLLFALFSQSQTKRHVFFKLSSLCLYYSGLIQKAAANIKTIAIYRNPIETMVALCESDKPFPPQTWDEQALMAPHLGLEATALAAMPREEYIALHLHTLLQKIKALGAQTNSYIIDYKAVPNAIIEGVVPWLNLRVSEAELHHMHEASQYYSKNSTKRVFVSDNSDKHKRLTPALKQYLGKPLATYQLLANL